MTTTNAVKRPSDAELAKILRLAAHTIREPSAALRTTAFQVDAAADALEAASAEPTKRLSTPEDIALVRARLGGTEGQMTGAIRRILADVEGK